MPLHLTKVAVGCASIDALRNRVARRVTQAGEVRVPTRMRPRRGDELVGGSLHWIVKHRIVARQLILRLDDRPDGRIDIVCAGELEIVTPIPRRAHQGWRYFEVGEEARADDSGLGELPPALYGKLRSLALV